MTAKVDPRTEKYSIPRNKMIPDTPLIDILTSDPTWKTADGKTDGQAQPMYRTADPTLPKSALVKSGKFFPFKIGAVYVFDESQTEVSKLFDAIKDVAGVVLPGAAEMTGWAAPLVEKAGEALLEAVGEKLREGDSQPQGTVAETIKVLEKRGMIVMPGVNLVEAQHQIDPGGFFARERHRVILTYEGLDGHRVRYGALFNPSNAQLAAGGASGMIQMMLVMRYWGEVDYLHHVVVREYVPNADLIFLETVADYHQRYGDGPLGSHAAAFMQDYNARIRSEQERNGYTLAKLAQRMLELLAPMEESYENVIILKDLMKTLRDVAAGKTE